MASLTSIKQTLEYTMFRCDLREKQRLVLWMLLVGKEQKEISQSLHMSEEAIKKHQRIIYRKLGIKGKAQLSKWVLEQVSSSITDPQPMTKEEFFRDFQNANSN
ncbi:MULTISPECIES: helix-turn-helix transcriptional regulator [Paenibacillus]|uniref:Helix-turn-helix transcriptional regulator n=1 Tax=Paenibacillus vandeheii TaxID=3035917 RepID=A0ABT8JFW4_9BACL|nr:MULTISPECIES: helix-turn-helix transcriptional regulator [Paenibacillus]KGP77793.1 hypothetical protein P364_0131510 [Paenibacillus sp. MAEPY2]KGP79560.1 hypothetical protein P363_0131005 [Paenibacillus sp. MAEPY1]MDN4603979.1 helix-turn-helix transcriptional regulator [Paenibacillus vandeheii]